MLFTDDAIKEIDDKLNDKSFYLDTNGKIMYSIKSDTLEFTIGHLTDVPKDVKLSTEDNELSNEWYNDNIKEENEVQVKEVNSGSYNLKHYYYAGEDGIIYKQLNMNDRVVYKPMRAFTTKDGYIEYVLTRNDGKKQHVQGQRLVALTYHGEPDSKEPMYVNHKDGNRSNNIPDNLEWVTASENIRHSFDVLGKVVHNAQAIAYLVKNETVMTKKELSKLTKKINEHIKDVKLKLVVGETLNEIPDMCNIVIALGNNVINEIVDKDIIAIGTCSDNLNNNRIVLDIDTIPSKHCNDNYKIELGNNEINKIIKTIRKYERKD